MGTLSCLGLLRFPESFKATSRLDMNRFSFALNSMDLYRVIIWVLRRFRTSTIPYLLSQASKTLRMALGKYLSRRAKGLSEMRGRLSLSWITGITWINSKGFTRLSSLWINVTMRLPVRKLFAIDAQRVNADARIASPR